MKNIHVLPTDKPSRLYLGNNGNFVFGMIKTSIQSKNDSFTNQNLYITSDEEIKTLEYEIYYNKVLKKVGNATSYGKKIILTTDQDLIKDGVQAIDDEFLEWFVKNPSCEEVEVENVYKKFLNGDKRSVSDFRNKYKIIIPKEEPKYDINTCKYFDQEVGCDLVDCHCEKQKILSDAKDRAKQETLEENLAKTDNEKLLYQIAYNKGVLYGSKWQAERMYSEEEVLDLLQKRDNYLMTPTTQSLLDFLMPRKWFEQFKKKQDETTL